MLSTTPTRPRLLGPETVTPPAEELLSLEEAKGYLNVKRSGEDVLIGDMIVAIGRHIEQKTHRALITQTVRTMWAASSLPLRILRPPVQSLVSVTTKYQGADTDEDEADFYIFGKGSLRPELRFTSTGGWTASAIEEVWIETKNGYGDSASNVPQDLIEAARRGLSVLYDHRDLFVEGRANIEDMPLGIESLIGNYIVPV